MRACVQRVSRAQVMVAGQAIGEIGHGLVVLLGVAEGDTEADSQWMAEKIVTLRIFEDAEGKMNRSLAEIEGSLLAVSQFTLLGDCRKGRRPSFVAAADPALAESLYEHFVQQVRVQKIVTATGKFRAEMEVSLVNEGPVTMLLDSQKLF